MSGNEAEVVKKPRRRARKKNKSQGEPGQARISRSGLPVPAPVLPKLPSTPLRFLPLGNDAPAAHRLRMLQWLSGLGVEQRRSLISLVDRDLASMLVVMVERQRHDGPGFFFEVGKGETSQIPQRNIVTYSRAISASTARTLNRKSMEKKKSQSNVKGVWGFADDYFVSKKSFTLNRRTEPFLYRTYNNLERENVQLTPTSRRAELLDQLLQQELRLGDTIEYMDTITLTSFVLADFPLFFQLMVRHPPLHILPLTLFRTTPREATSSSLLARPCTTSRRSAGSGRSPCGSPRWASTRSPPSLPPE